MYHTPVHLFGVLIVVCAAASDNVFSVDKGVIVHLFEWKYPDIAKECEEFLAPHGFSGVQISPPSENIMIHSPERPWWERYQPISYKLVSRSGTQEELEDMITRCNKVGVRIFADAVLNHMTANHKPAEGVGGSTADTSSFSYPAVPYTAADFHWPICSVNNYNNATEVRVCEVTALHDLDNSKNNVRQKQEEYLNSMIEMGVAGFRIDDAKHMWPEDLKKIYSGLKNLNTKQGFPENTKPLLYQEVIDLGGEAVKYQEYAPLGMVTDFRYGNDLGKSFQGQTDLVYLKNFDTAWDLVPEDAGLVFIDNHDTQRGSNANVLNYKKFRPYKMALAFMLAFPYGTPLVLSSFYFDKYDQGPPHDNNNHILSPQPIRDNLCANKWVCEHRWRQVYNMVNFKNVVKGTKVTDWWDNGKNQIAFCRGNKGFIAFNRETSAALDRKLQTCLPKGKYCDVISGELVNNACTGKTVEVGEDGTGQVQINAFNMYDPNVENDGVLALHVKEAIIEKKETPDESSKDKDKDTKSDNATKKPSTGESKNPSSGSSSSESKKPSTDAPEEKKPSSGTGAEGNKNKPSTIPSEGTQKPTACSCDSHAETPSAGSAGACERLLQLMTSSGSSSSSCSLLGAGTDDLTLLAAVARVRKLEKLLNLLTLI